MLDTLRDHWRLGHTGGWAHALTLGTASDIACGLVHALNLDTVEDRRPLGNSGGWVHALDLDILQVGKAF